MRIIGLFLKIFILAGLTSACDQEKPRTSSPTFIALTTDGMILPALILPARAGETLTINGLETNADFSAMIAGQELIILGSTVTLPSHLTAGLHNLDIWQAETYKGSLFLQVQASGSEPTILAEENFVCENVTYRDAKGVLKNGTLNCTIPNIADCSSDGQSGCLSTELLPSIDLNGKLKPSLGLVRDTLTIAGQQGQLALCGPSENGACYVDSSNYHGLTLDDVDASRIRVGYSLFGVDGALGACSASLQTGCWTSGSYFAAETCDASGSNCTLPLYGSTSFLKAVDSDALIPGVIRSNTNIGGVNGDYPSIANPLPVSDSATDLDENLTFTNADLGWFNRDGARLTRSGAPQLVAANIRQGTTIHGIDGILPSPNPWDLRRGVNIGSIQGLLPLNCRNPQLDLGLSLSRPAVLDPTTDRVTLAGHGFALNDAILLGFGTAPAPLTATNYETTIYYAVPIDTNTFQIALDNSTTPVFVDFTTTGSNLTVARSLPGSVDPFETVSDVPIEYPSISTSYSWDALTHTCYGEAPPTLTEPQIFVDVSTLCATTGTQCRHEDKITKLQWTGSFSGTYNWAAAVRYCEDLVHDGFSDWRLPTLRESMAVSVHGMTTAWALTNNDHWTSTSVSADISKAWAGFPRIASSASPLAKNTAKAVQCVRP